MLGAQTIKGLAWFLRLATLELAARPSVYRLAQRGERRKRRKKLQDSKY
jgi:hypothetical protein